MGAGFAIAMRDLEFRGAGNVLGTQQSGHIATVGYELYCQLLEVAVRRLRKMPLNDRIDVNIDLPGEAHLPIDYVPNMRSKIDLYRRVCRVASDAQLQEIQEELVDRFGPPPAPAQRMLATAALRIDAAVWSIASIFLEDGYLVLVYSDRQRVEQLARQLKGRLRIVDDHSAYLPITKEQRSSEQILDIVKDVLQPN